MSIAVLETTGSAHERGRQHGVLMAAAIAANVETYLDRFAAGGLDRDAALASAEAWIPRLARINPDYHEEMVGIAAGADLPLRVISLLNVRYELTYGVFGAESKAKSRPTPEPDGCTSFGLLPERTESGHVVLGQNWDWLERVQGKSFVMRARRDGQPDFLAVMEAGIVGAKMAVNEHGIGLCINGLVSRHDGVNDGAKPFHVRCREIIDARRYDQALLAILSGARMGSANFLVGTAEGEIIDIETAPDDHACIYPVDGVITHANHFDAMPGIGSKMETISAGTLFRGDRLRRLLARGGERLSHDHMRACLSDHVSHPQGICRHPDPGVIDAKRTVTAVAVIIDLDDRRIWAADGPPCEAAFESFTL